MLIRTVVVGDVILIELAGKAFVRINLVSSSPHKVQLGIDAPGHVRVHRPELTDPEEAYKVIDFNKFLERKKRGKSKK